MIEERNIGSEAEAALDLWAKQAGITSNPSQEDKEGWDFILELPTDSSTANLPLDQRDIRIECKIQVKAVNESRKRVGVELSNLEKMVKSKLPSFYLIIIYGDDIDPKAAYLIHVGKELISKVLRRLRESSVAENEARLNKKYIYLTWKEDERIRELNGKSLRAAIQQTVGNDTNKYNAWKQEIIKNVGNPIPSILKTTMQFAHQDEMYSTLVDLSLGLRENIETVRTEIQENIRFDIPAKKRSFEGGVFSTFARPISDVRLIFRDADRNIQSEVIGQIFNPFTFFPDGKIPQEYQKLRIVLPFGEIITDPKNQNASYQINLSDMGKILTMREHYNVWKMPAILLRNRDSNGCHLEIFTMDGELITSGKFPPQKIEDFPIDILRVILAFEDLWFVVKNFDISPETKISIEDAVSQYRSARLIRGVYDPQKEIKEIAGMITNPSENTEKIALPFYEELLFGDKILIVYGGLVGQMILKEDKVTFSIKKPKPICLNSKVFFLNDKYEKAEFIRLLYESITLEGYKYLTLAE